jgi:hypothetical protein
MDRPDLFHPSLTRPARPRPELAAAVLAALFLALAVPLILRFDKPTRATWDQDAYHLPTVVQFVSEWPRPNFSEYNSATTPGYHLVLAAVRKLTGAGDRALRIVASLFTVGLLATFGWSVGKRVGPWTAAAVGLPLVCSAYVFSSGVWLLPDNAGWWGVLGMLLVAMRPRVDWRTYAGGGAVLLALVLVRQLHLWTAALLVVAAWLGPGANAARDVRVLDAAAGAEPPSRKLKRAMLAALCTVPAVLALGWFFRLWHGATPPGPRSLNAGINPAAPPMVLAVIGVVGTFYAGFLAPRAGALRRAWPALLAGFVIAGLTAAVPQTSYNPYAGRWSGLWNLAEKLPVYADRSPLVIALAAWGGLVVAAWAVALPHRTAWIFLTACLAFTAAHTATHEAYQRYYEPFAIMLFGLAAVRVRSDWVAEGGATQAPTPGWAALGPLLLAGLLAYVTVNALANYPPAQAAGAVERATASGAEPRI